MTLLDFAAAAMPVLLVAGIVLVHVIYYLLIAKIPTQMRLKEEKAPRRAPAQQAPSAAARKESAA